MKSNEVLREFEHRWPTSMGAFFPEERVVYRGKDLHRELNHLSWTALLMLGITGRILSESEIQAIEGMWRIAISYPDPRLWNNRVAALAGTTRSTASLGIGAATAVTEAVIYGNRLNKRAIDFLYRLDAELQAGGELEPFVLRELKTYRVVPGYGRPLRPTDERREPLIELAKSCGVYQGVHFQRCLQIDRFMQESRYRFHINASGLCAAIGAEIGLNPEEYHQACCIGFSAGMFPCYNDTKTKPEGAFFPFRCDRLVYQGKADRPWQPKATLDWTSPLGRARVVRRITASADRVWRLIRQFDGLEKYLASVSSSKKTGTSPGDVRNTILQDGTQMIHRLEEMNDQKRLLRHRLLYSNPALPHQNYQGRIHVQEQGPEACQLTFSSEFDVNENKLIEVCQTLEATYGTMADELAAYLNVRCLPVAEGEG